MLANVLVQILDLVLEDCNVWKRRLLGLELLQVERELEVFGSEVFFALVR
jgi:hypothetical protein